MPTSHHGSSLSTGAKAGVGVGAAIGALVIIALLTTLARWLRRDSQPRPGPHYGGSGGNGGNGGLAELGVAPIAAGEKKNGRSRPGDQVPTDAGGANVRPGRTAGQPLPDAAGAEVLLPAEKTPTAGHIAELGAPLSPAEKQELQNRRRAAQLTGQGADIPVEDGSAQRRELEARRKAVYELP